VPWAVVLLFCLCVAVRAGEVADAEKRAEALIAKADAALAAGDADEAVRLYREAAQVFSAETERLDQADREARAAAADAAKDWTPPATLGHAPETPEEARREIDALVKRLMDPFVPDRLAAEAGGRLAEHGRRAFLPLLGSMARVRDRVGGKDSLDERLLRQALARGDRCLRRIDGHLDALGKPGLGPASSRDEIAHVLRVHHRRWHEKWKLASPSGHEAGRGKRFGSGRRRPSRWDPPATLGHLKTTPPAKRKQIDALVAVMMDPMAGRKSLDAKEKLAAIGKPAFLPVLRAMARARDAITDKDTVEERLLESSLKLADECLRTMDGFLDSKGKQPIRPGTDRKYIRYILRLHYRRWMEHLKDLAAMPGPFAGR